MAKAPLKVLLAIFPGFNTLDLNGPLEVLKNSALPDDTFTTYIGSATELTTACEGVQIKRDVSFADVLDPHWRRPCPVTLSDLDAVIIAGGRRHAIDAVLNAKDGAGALRNLVSHFSTADTESKPRWLISICTGSEILANSGALHGKPATTHWAAIPQLQALSKKLITSSRSEEIDVQRKRWIDAGVSETGVRLITSGGISCGIDCVLWYVSQVVDLDSAKKVALFMDYPWAFADVEHTKGYLVGGTDSTTESGHADNP